jgi:hypothetical protein
MNTLLLQNKLKYLFKSLLFTESEQDRKDICSEISQIYLVLGN